MKKAMRASPVVFAQNAVKLPDFASPVRATDFVQHSAMNAIAKIVAAANNTIAPGIAARNSVIDQAPASQTSHQVATRVKSFAARGSGATGGKACGNVITVANS